MAGSPGSRPVWDAWRPYLIYAVTLLCLSNVLNVMDRTALSILMPAMQREFGLSDLQLGLLSGVAFAVFYALFGIPLARLADKGSRRNLIAASVALWSLMTVLTGMTHSFGQLLLTRVGVGVGEAGGTPPAHSMITDHFVARRRAGVLALHSAAVPMGSLLGLAIGGWLAERVGWRWTFVDFGAPGVALALLMRFTLREPARRGEGAAAAAGPILPLWSCVKILLTKRSFACVLIGTGGAGLAVSGLAQWLPTYFLRAFDMSLAQVGLYVGLAFGLGSFVGILAGGPIGDRLAAVDRRWYSWIAAWGYGLCGPLIAVALFLKSAVLALSLIFVAFAVMSVLVGPVWALVQLVAPPRFRALAVALTLLAGNLVGGGMGPTAVGYISDLFNTGSAAASLRIGMLCLMVFFPIPVVLYWLGGRYVLRDLDASAAGDG